MSALDRLADTAPDGTGPLAPTPRPRLEFRHLAPRLAAGLALLVVLNVAARIWIVTPAAAEVEQLRESRRTAEATEQAATKALDELRAVRQRATDAQQRIDRFYRELLSTKKERLVPFQLALLAATRDANVPLERITLGGAMLGDERIETLSVGLPLEGGYENLRQVLARLEALEQFVIVREVGLTGGREGGRSLQLNIGLETYFNAPEAEALAAGAAGRGRGAADRGARGGAAAGRAPRAGRR